MHGGRIGLIQLYNMLVTMGGVENIGRKGWPEDMYINSGRQNLLEY